jgi:hypothetical protein
MSNIAAPRGKSSPMFQNISFRIIPLFLSLTVVFQSSLLWADTVTAPVHLSYPFLRQLLTLTVFNGHGNTAEILIDPSGCTKVILSEPRLTGRGNALRLIAKARATLAMESENGCISPIGWMGQAEVVAQPVVLPGPSQAVRFQVEDSNLYDQQGERLASGIVWDNLKECVHSILGRFQVDFSSSIDELKALLPIILPQHPTAQMKRVIDSLHLAGVRVGPDGLTVEISLEVEAAPSTGSVAEPLLTGEEIERWEQQWESWDAFLTFIIKRMAAATESTPLRATLLEILLDARYEFRNALRSDTPNEADPVRQLFVRSWQRLVPVLQEISATLPGREPFAILDFLTAGDALQALDQLGPALRLEISTDGLRRLARLVGDSPGVDPLRYEDEVDPELRRLFGFDPVEKEQRDPEPPKYNFRWIRPAFAGTSSQHSLERLNKWVPTRNEIDQYLPLVRELLDQNANFLLKGVNISPPVASVYQKLVLAAAWQESCWRQYIVQKRKLIPLRSNSGDVGLMQVNERVWRGFYSKHKLRWDIGYNARAGSEILLKYLVDYALPKGEHKQGDIHHLARATYSAYNGGPGQLSRYRNLNAPAMHRKIDTAFWKKYQAVQNGKEYNVAECLGGTAAGALLDKAGHDKRMSGEKTEAPRKSSSPKPLGANGLKEESWILAQNPKHFTIQIATLSRKKTLHEFIHKQPHPERVAYYRLKRNGKRLYGVIYGAFAKRSDAEKAALRLGFVKPWMRDFGSLQEIIKRYGISTTN